MLIRHSKEVFGYGVLKKDSKAESLNRGVDSRGIHRYWLIVLSSVLVVSTSLIGIGTNSSNFLPSAFADARAEQLKKKKVADDKLAKTQAELEGVNNKLAKTVLALQKTQADAVAAKKAYDSAAVKLNQAQVDQAQVSDRLNATIQRLEKIQEEIKSSQAKQTEVQKSLGQVARDIYVNREDRGVLGLLVNHVSTSELGQYMRNAALASKIQNESLREVKEKLVVAKTAEAEQTDLKKQVEDLKQQADQLVATAKKAQLDKEAKMVDLQNHLATEKQLNQALESQKSSLQADMAAAQAEQAAAAAEIARIDEENRKAAAALAAAKESAAGVGRGESGGGKSVNSSGFRAGDIFQAPITGELYVTSPYGWRIHPVLGTKRLHAGVDIRSACGNQQFAAASGTVVSTRFEGSGGNTVTINHGIIDGISWVTKYRHMTKFAVHAGQKVDKGTMIGYTGSTGRVTGCHVHFEIWKNGSTINPMGML